MDVPIKLLCFFKFCHFWITDLIKIHYVPTLKLKKLFGFEFLLSFVLALLNRIFTLDILLMLESIFLQWDVAVDIICIF